MRDVRTKHEKIMVEGGFSGDVLELRNVNYELKYKDYILIVRSVQFIDTHFSEGYFQRKMIAFADCAYCEFEILATFVKGLK